MTGNGAGAGRVQFSLLGPLMVWRDGQMLELGPPKQRAVLAVLLVHANQALSLDRLIDLVWGEKPPNRAAGALQAYISNLRRILEPERPARCTPQVLVSQAPGYCLQVAADDVDAHRFQETAGRGHQLLTGGDAGRAETVLAEALAMWRGAALADFAYDSFAQGETARLEELRQVAIEARLESRLALGEPCHVIADLEVAVADAPLRERRRELLMLALYRCGRQGEALRAYREARRVLGEELGIEPSPALRRLEADILAQAASLDWQPPDETAETPPAATATPPQEAAPQEAAPQPVTARPSHRGPSPTPVIGREAELRRLTAAAGPGATVLVAGEAGIGKTSLVAALAARATPGTITAWGSCHERGAPPLWPWRQVIAHLVSQFGPSALAETLTATGALLARLVPEINDIVPLVPAAPTPRGTEGPGELFAAVATFLGRLGAGQRLTVVIEDLHWADNATLDLLEFVAATTADTAVTLVATYRDHAAANQHRLHQTLGALARLPRHSRITVTGLPETDIGRHVAAAVGTQARSAVVAAIATRSAGNPFYAAELARHLHAAGQLDSETAANSAVPSAVRDITRQSLAPLPERTRLFLSLAAHLGADFDIQDAADIDGLALDDALTMVDQAARTGVIAEDLDRPGRYRFRHPVTRDAVHREVSVLRGAQWQRRISQRLAAAAANEPIALADRPPTQTRNGRRPGAGSGRHHPRTLATFTAQEASAER